MERCKIPKFSNILLHNRRPTKNLIIFDGALTVTGSGGVSNCRCRIRSLRTGTWTYMISRGGACGRKCGGAMNCWNLSIQSQYFKLSVRCEVLETSITQHLTKLYVCHTPSMLQQSWLNSSRNPINRGFHLNYALDDVISTIETSLPWAMVSHLPRGW